MSKTYKEDLTGKKFGYLTVINFIKDDTKKTRWLCKCDCGKNKIVLAYALKDETVRSCGCLKQNVAIEKINKKKEIYINSKHNKLTIIDLYIKNKRIYAKCLCDCGNEANTTLNRVISKSTASCWCSRSESVRLDFGMSTFNDLLYGYKKAAELRKLSFNLTRERALELFNGDCVYCGSEPTRKRKRNKAYGFFIYNGIDRVDSSIGYEDWNVVSCCSVCNMMKKAMSRSDFIKHSIKIAKNNKEEFLWEE